MKSIFNAFVVLVLLCASPVATALQPSIVASGLSSPLVLAVDGDWLYFATNTNTLYRVPKASSNLASLPPPVLGPIGDAGGINDLAFDPNYMFVHIGGYTNGYITRTPKVLGSPTTYFVSTNAGLDSMIGVIGTNISCMGEVHICTNDPDHRIESRIGAYQKRAWRAEILWSAGYITVRIPAYMNKDVIGVECQVVDPPLFAVRGNDWGWNGCQ